MDEADTAQGPEAMTDDAAAPRPSDDDDEAPDYATAIYGSLLVTSLVAVQWRADPSTEAIGLSLFVSVFVFWLAHAWSRIINQRVRGPITVRHATAIAIAEGPLLVAAIPPALVLGLSRLPGASTDVVMAAALVVWPQRLPPDTSTRVSLSASGVYVVTPTRPCTSIAAVENCSENLPS